MSWALAIDAVPHDDLLEQRVAEPLRRPALDLSAGERGMNRLADLVHHGDPERPDLPGVGIQLDLGDVAAPGVGGVGVAAIVVSSHWIQSGCSYWLVTASGPCRR